MPPPGTPGGIQIDELRSPSGVTGVTAVTCVDYSPERVAFEDVADVDGFLGRHRPEWSRVRWINVDGLGRLDVIRAVAEKYQLHPLVIEDVLNRAQAPKVEDYPASPDQPGRLFIVARAIEEEDGILRTEQVSMFLGRTTLLTFQEQSTEDFDPVRARIKVAGSRLRENDVSFLLYVLLDGIVDHYFPVLDRISQRIEALEDELLDRQSQNSLAQIHAIRRELILVRRSAWPMREVVAQLQRDRHECLSGPRRPIYATSTTTRSRSSTSSRPIAR